MSLANSAEPHATATGISASSSARRFGDRPRHAKREKLRTSTSAPATSASVSAMTPHGSKRNGGCGCGAIMGVKRHWRTNTQISLVAFTQRSGDEHLLLRKTHHCRWSTAIFSRRCRVRDCRWPYRSRYLRHAAAPAPRRSLRRSRSGRLRARRAVRVGAANVPMIVKRADDILARGARAWPTRSTIVTALAHALHNAAMGHQFGGDRERTFLVCPTCGERSRRNLDCCRGAPAACVHQWAGRARSVSGARRGSTPDRCTRSAVRRRAGPVPQLYLGLAGEVLLAAGRPVGWRSRHLDFAIAGYRRAGCRALMCRDPLARRMLCWRSGAATRTRLDGLSRLHATALGRQGALIFERRAEACLAEVTNIRLVAETFQQERI